MVQLEQGTVTAGGLEKAPELKVSVDLEIVVSEILRNIGIPAHG